MGLESAPVWLCLIALVGCGKLSDILHEPNNHDEEEVYSTPTGDGSHYIAIFADPKTPSGSMQRRWVKHATKVCEGDYLVLSENASERRRGGFVESRVYEGWVRCLSPDVSIDEAKSDDPPANKTVASGPGASRRKLGQ
jgi:hypothetical protein